jgi:hypothetical protein
MVVGGPIYFRGDSDGNAVSFDARASFAGVHFKSLAEFINLTFKGAANFAAARMESDVRFDGTVFQGPASFCDAFLRTATFRPDLTEAIPGDQSPQFLDSVDLRGLHYERIGIAWAEALDRLAPYDRQPYVRLEAHLRASAHDREADNVYWRRCHVEGRQKSLFKDTWGKLADLLYRYVCNYGVRPVRLGFFALVLIALGTYVFSPAGAVLPKETAVVSKAALAERPPWTVYDAFAVTIHHFLPIEVPMGSQWVPSDTPRRVEFQFGEFQTAIVVRPSDYATILKIAGWILGPLILAAITGILRRGNP